MNIRSRERAQELGKSAGATDLEALHDPPPPVQGSLALLALQAWYRYQ
jgi:hypothetical protein